MKKSPEESTLNADDAFSAMFELFKAKPWLVGKEDLTEMNPLAENEAISFILSITSGAPDGWGNISKDAKNVVTSLMMDFIAKLRMPNSPFSKVTWQVPAGLAPWQQALEIIAYEIRQAHPVAANKH